MKKYILIIIFLCLIVLSGCDLTNNRYSSVKSGVDSSQTLNSSAVKSKSELKEIDKEFIDNTKNYIRKGISEGKSGPQYKWSESFLDDTEFDALYKSYISEQKEKDVESFAMFATKNAPENVNWKSLFEKDFKEQDNMVATKYESLGDGFYQVYVEIDGNQTPYITVNAHTGWAHG